MSGKKDEDDFSAYCRKMGIDPSMLRQAAKLCEEHSQTIKEFNKIQKEVDLSAIEQAANLLAGSHPKTL